MDISIILNTIFPGEIICGKKHVILGFTFLYVNLYSCERFYKVILCFYMNTNWYDASRTYIAVFPEKLVVSVPPLSDKKKHNQAETLAPDFDKHIL